MPTLMRDASLGSAAEAPAARPSPPDPDAEARLLSASVARGDEAAFERLYYGYRQRLLRFALVLARGDDGLAQDAVQAAFTTTAAKLRRVESEKHLWNWLALVTRQHLAKLNRQRRREGVLLPLVNLHEERQSVDADSVLEQSLDAALALIDSEERQLVEWFYFEHLSQKEIAERLGATPKAISSRLERARARLRSLLKKGLSDEL